MNKLKLLVRRTSRTTARRGVPLAQDDSDKSTGWSEFFRTGKKGAWKDDPASRQNLWAVTVARILLCGQAS